MGGPTPTVATANANAQPDPQQLAPDLTGSARLRFLMQQGQPDPIDVARLLQANPAERDAMIQTLQQSYGNGYVQQVMVASQTLPSEPKAIGGIGSSFGPNAFPAAPKNPGDKLPSNMTQDDADANRAQLAPPPGSLYADGQDGLQRQQTPSYIGTNVPVQGAPGQVLPTPDSSTTSNGTRWADTSTTTRNASPGGMSTTVDGTKVVAVPGSDQSPEAQAAALAKYRAAVSTALDEQITSLEPKHGSADADAKAAQADLKTQKAAIATASVDDLDALVAKNKLLVAVPDDVRATKVTTTTRGANLGGVFDGSAIAANNTKTTTVTTAPGAPTTTTTTDSTNELSTKGVNFSRGNSTTTADPTAGSVNGSSSKTSLTGGITDPLKAQYSSTTTQADAASNSSTVTTKAISAQSGNGFAGVGGSLGIAKGDPAKVDPASDGTSVAPQTSTARPSATIAGQAGVIQNDKGSGFQAGVNDARVDAGNSKVAAGAYGAADGSLQVLVTPTPDGGVVITFTAMVHMKLGAFVGKRGAADPVTTGSDTSASGGAYGVHNRTVTRTRKLSKDEAAQLIGDLDKLASGVDGQGKKTFGTRAAAAAYTRVFNSKLEDLALGDPVPGPGETLSIQNETGGGAEAKVGASDGDSANARANIGASGGYEKLVLSGREETPNAQGTTLKLMFGDRTSRNAGLSGGFGSAGGTGGVSDMKQATTTYVFSIPKDQSKLLEEARAISDEQAAKDFAANHKDLVGGTAKGNIDQDSSNVGVNVGPIAMGGSTTSTVDGNVAFNKKTVTDPDGTKHTKDSLSGTQDGTRDDKANLSLAGVKLAQGQTTTTSHGTVDDDGQASLDVTTSSSSSNVVSAVPANLKANDKTDLAAAAATGGGPMGLIKKLAERVGEQSTIGAHFDNAAFEQLVGIATSDSVRWSRAITTQYRTEWFTLQNSLAHPNPPKDWLDHDDSTDHVAAKTLAQMKAFATFVSVSGTAGQTAISRLRGEYSANAIGETVSWPPSLQDQRPVYDGLAKSVEHLKPTLVPYAESGDLTGGNAFLDKLTADLGALRTKVQNAPDHENQTLALRAANGIGDMQETVTTYKDRFANAIAAFNAKKPAADIDAELDAKVAKSTQMIATSDAASTQAWKAKQAAAQMTPPADNASPATWAAYNKQFAAAVQTEADTKKAADQARANENQQRADEAAATAKKNIGDYEQRCLNDKNSASQTVWDAVGALPGTFGSDDGTKNKLLSLGNQMKQWAQDWDALKGYYKDAGMPDGTRADLKPALPQSPFKRIAANTSLSDNWKGYAAELRNQWGGSFD